MILKAWGLRDFDTLVEICNIEDVTIFLLMVKKTSELAEVDLEANQYCISTEVSGGTALARFFDSQTRECRGALLDTTVSLTLLIKYHVSFSQWVWSHMK